MKHNYIMLMPLAGHWKAVAKLSLYVVEVLDYRSHTQKNVQVNHNFRKFSDTPTFYNYMC